MVGIDAPQNRYERYAMYTVSDWEYRARSSGRLLKRIRGYGDETAAFLIEQVKPYVEATYRAARDRDQVGVAGSSMGGYMSLVVGTRYPDRVSKVLAFSPVALDEPLRGFELREAIVGAGAPVTQRYYLDMGDRERLDYVRDPQELVDNLQELRSALAQAGHRDVLARVVPGGHHDERAWARRFPEAYLWAYFGVEPS